MTRTLIALLVALPFFSSANDICQDLDSTATKKGISFDNTDNVFKVGGEGRLQFYSAPDKKCLEKGVFVIPGNSLYAYVEYHGYYSVMYLSDDGDQVTGWVEKDRLIDMHKGIAPDYNQNAQQKKSN